MIWGFSSTFFILILFINQSKIALLFHLQQWPKLSDMTKIVSMAPLGLIFPFVYPLPFRSALGSSLNYPQALLALTDIRGTMDSRRQLNFSDGSQG